MKPSVTDLAPESGKMLADYMRARVTKEETNKIQCHSYSEIVFIKSGDMTYSTGDKIVRISAHSIIYNREGMIHNPFVQYSQIYERYKIKFYESDLTDGCEILKDELKESFVKELCEADFDEIYSSVRRIYSALEKNKPDPRDELYVKTELRAIILKIPSLHERELQRDGGYIAKAAQFINDHVKDKLTIDMIAGTFFVSKSKLIYDFREYCNMSVNEYITLVRTEKAKELLKCGYSVSSVASECGFSSSSYFIKVFFSVVGETPLKYQLSNTKR